MIRPTIFATLALIVMLGCCHGGGTPAPGAAPAAASPSR
jgi:hypothetical protein